MKLFQYPRPARGNKNTRVTAAEDRGESQCLLFSAVRLETDEQKLETSANDLNERKLRHENQTYGTAHSDVKVFRMSIQN